VVEPVREAIWSVDPTQPIARIFPMSEVVAQWVAIPRAVRTLISALAALALSLAAVGVFGVVAYAVRSRTAELGVRMALGASPGRLTRELLAGTVPMVALGLAVGLGAGWAAARAARAVLFGVGPLDPVSLAVAIVAMGSAAVLAILVPARRISRIHPAGALKAE
jgi:ABC-type antimicrobial peptide transport system permease subunit